jgi:hypothetical protein
MQTLPALVMEWIVVIFIGLLGLIVLYNIWCGKIDLTGLLNEPAVGPGASPLAAAGGGGGAGGAAGAAAGGAGGAAGAAASGAGGPAAGGSKASMSRLQLLIFTFIIAGLYLTLCFEAGEMIAIPNQVLGILGISGGSYVVSKGIQMQPQS